MKQRIALHRHNKGRKDDVSFDPCFEFFQGKIWNGLSVQVQKCINLTQKYSNSRMLFISSLFDSGMFFEKLYPENIDRYSRLI